MFYLVTVNPQKNSNFGIGDENDKPKKETMKERISTSEEKVITKDNNVEKKIKHEKDSYSEKQTVRD